MADETMEDSAFPLAPADQPVTDCVLIYGGGDTPHTWTPADMAEQKARYRLPGYVRSDPQNASYIQDANAFTAWLKVAKVPVGSSTFLDLETAVAPGYVSAFGYVMGLEGYPVLPYGSLSTVWQNPHLDGLFTAHYTDRPHLCTPSLCGLGLNANAKITQYADSTMTGGGYDLSLIDPSVPLWDTRPAPAAPIVKEDDLFLLCTADSPDGKIKKNTIWHVGDFRWEVFDIDLENGAPLLKASGGQIAAIPVWHPAPAVTSSAPVAEKITLTGTETPG